MPSRLLASCCYAARCHCIAHLVAVDTMALARAAAEPGRPHLQCSERICGRTQIDSFRDTWHCTAHFRPEHSQAEHCTSLLAALGSSPWPDWILRQECAVQLESFRGQQQPGPALPQAEASRAHALRNWARRHLFHGLPRPAALDPPRQLLDRDSYWGGRFSEPAAEVCGCLCDPDS